MPFVVHILPTQEFSSKIQFLSFISQSIKRAIYNRTNIVYLCSIYFLFIFYLLYWAQTDTKVTFHPTAQGGKYYPFMIFLNCLSVFSFYLSVFFFFLLAVFFSFCPSVFFSFSVYVFFLFVCLSFFLFISLFFLIVYLFFFSFLIDFWSCFSDGFPYRSC